MSGEPSRFRENEGNEKGFSTGKVGSVASKASAGPGSSKAVKSLILMYWDTSARKAVVHNYKEKGNYFDPLQRRM